MIVQAGWPGATMDDTLQQVTERLERKLQETRGLDFLRSYTIPGRTTIFVNLKGSTRPSEVPDIWYQVRKNIGDIPRHAAVRRCRTRLQRRLRRHVRLDLRLHRRRLQPPRAARLCRGHSFAPASSSGRVEDRAPRKGQEPKARPLDREPRSSDFIRASGPSPRQKAGHMTEGRQPFTAEIKMLAKGPSTYDPLENRIRCSHRIFGQGPRD
jgi:hypothetical protein